MAAHRYSGQVWGDLPMWWRHCCTMMPMWTNVVMWVMCVRDEILQSWMMVACMYEQGVSHNIDCPHLYCNEALLCKTLSTLACKLSSLCMYTILCYVVVWWCYFRLQCYANSYIIVASSPGRSHLVNIACNIEKAWVAWGQGYCIAA